MTQLLEGADHGGLVVVGSGFERHAHRELVAGWFDAPTLQQMREVGRLGKELATRDARGSALEPASLWFTPALGGLAPKGCSRWLRGSS